MAQTSQGPATEPMPEELSPRRLRKRLIEIAVVVAVVVIVVVAGPGLGPLRRDLEHASGGWVAAGVGLELLSMLSYVVIFRSVFCPRMSWRLSYQIGMAEQAANSVLSVSGAGGLALGVWALRRGGMSVEHIARRTVAFFFLTSAANIGAVILFAGLYAIGVLHHDRDPALTYGFGAAALIASAVVLTLPALLGRGEETPDDPDAGRLRRAVRLARLSLGQGVRDGLILVRRQPAGVLGGAIGTMVFDLAVLAAAFKALGHSPSVGVLVLGYLIGQLGGNIPVPGGIGGLDAGLVGAFVLYHQPLASTTAAVLIYHTISLWLPALVGSGAFIALRNTLRREEKPAAMCAPMAEPIEVVRLPVPASSGTGA